MDFGDKPGNWLLRGLVYVLILVGLGAFVGNVIFITYLFVASMACINLNEASTALASENFKNFVRLKVDGQNSLTVYLFGIDDTKDLDCSNAQSRCALQKAYRLPLD